jgi:hypothetical protein
MSYALLSFAISIAFSGCLSNEIHFDMQEQAIRSCNSNGLNHLRIEKDATEEGFSLQWMQQERAPTVIRLSSIDPGYYISSGYAYTIDNGSFGLQPQSMYTIEKSGGDAGAYRITVWTDQNGKVIKTDRENCGD